MAGARRTTLSSKRHLVTDKLAKNGKLGPARRLMPPRRRRLRAWGDPVVLDGPFAETNEALLGFYVIDCASLEDASSRRSRSGATKGRLRNPAREVAPAGSKVA